MTVSSVAPLAAYGGFVIERGGAGGAAVWSFAGHRVLRAFERRWASGDFGTEVHDAQGRRMLVLCIPRRANGRIDVRTGSGRFLGKLEARSVDDRDGRPVLEVTPFHLTPSDFAVVRLAPRRPRRVATIQRTWDDANDRRFLHAVTYEPDPITVEERALVLAAALSLRSLPFVRTRRDR